MPNVIGIDHPCITVSDLSRSQAIDGAVFLVVLGFSRNACEIGGDPHVQDYNRHVGYVLRRDRHDHWA